MTDLPTQPVRIRSTSSSQPIGLRSTSSALVHWRKLLRHLNWPLLVGGFLVALVVLMAILGPYWAPHDPMQENFTLKVDGQVTRPPYPPFKVPGYPLGTDSFGRDILSRLLWAVRPTLVMVLAVAVVRLALGLVIGLLVGWSSGRVGRWLDSFLSGALSIPVLIVALIAIAAVGIERGLIAFIVGMALTGWAETARLVAEQTRTIRSQTFVEASQALGASGVRILATHILRQILPLIWMLIAFEVSGTLLVSAELGFLGYYIGGGIWIEVEDFLAVNTTGLPELGQMLATALVTLTDPSGLIAVGTVLFLAILGFNLLGEGLRLRLVPEKMTARRPLFGLGGELGNWVEEHISQPVSNWVEDHALQVGLAGLIILLVSGWTFWMKGRPERTPVQSQSILLVPGGHPWANEKHDAQGTRWVGAEGPSASNILWEVQVPGGLTGGPVVSSNETIYIASRGQELLAFDTAGKEKWRTMLPEVPVGGPGLGPEGEIYVVGESGGLSAFSPEGNLVWQFQAQRGREGTSGPVVASNGMIYYTRVNGVQAVSPAGESVWNMPATSTYLETTPILSAGESYLFLKDGALAAASGAPLAQGDLLKIASGENEFSEPSYVIGAEGKNYVRAANSLLEWRSTEVGIETGEPITWASDRSALFFPTEAGVTPENLIWFFYATEFSDTRLVWLDQNSRMLGNVRIPAQNGRMIGIDLDSTAYLCAMRYQISPRCFAYELGDSNPKWEVTLAENLSVRGGALAPGRLYVTLDSPDLGSLVAIGQGSASASPAPEQATDSPANGDTDEGTATDVPPAQTADANVEEATPEANNFFLPSVNR